MNRIKIARETIEISKNRKYITKDNEEVSMEKRKLTDDIEYRNSEDIGKYNTKYQLVGFDDLDISGVEKRFIKPLYKVTDKGTLENIPFDADGYVILNFASTKHPGGGFETGAMAQEEDICYKSDLAYSLKGHKEFYKYNSFNLNRGMYTEGIIYSKDILIIRNPMMELVKPRKVAVITSAAPNAKVALKSGYKANDIRCELEKRIEHIVKVAIVNGKRKIILGAWGCGVFGNSAFDVANAFKKVLVLKGYEMYFNEIIFGIKCSKQDLNNYNTFKNVFKN